MNTRQFLIELSIISSVIGAILIGVSWFFPPLQVHSIFAFSIWLLFMLLSILFYWVGDKTSKSTNKNHFTNFFMISVFLKMMICALLILVYKNIVQPANTHFVWLFFIAYIGFTVFEIHFLTKQAKN